MTAPRACSGIQAAAGRFIAYSRAAISLLNRLGHRRSRASITP